MKELNEMTIGRTDDPENPFRVPAFEAAGLFGAGSRNPSGPAVMMPRQQAGHMIAVDPPVRILIETLEFRVCPVLCVSGSLGPILTEKGNHDEKHD
jgi:hypothetical protein